MNDKKDPAASPQKPSGKDSTENSRLRSELVAMIQRQAKGLDENRPEAVAKRQQKNQRTGRANVTDLYDPDSFMEYGAPAFLANRPPLAVSTSPARSMSAFISGVALEKQVGDPSRMPAAAPIFSRTLLKPALLPEYFMKLSELSRALRLRLNQLVKYPG